MTTKDKIEKLLTAAFRITKLEIIDDSDKHRNHQGVIEAGGGGHFQVKIISEDFERHTRIGRHRLINEALAELIPSEIHALSIQANTPIEFNIR